jgi:soluble lytic murein transglycosylase-like protein
MRGIGIGTALNGISQGFNQYQQQQYQNQQQQQLQNAQIQQMQANTDQTRAKTAIEQDQVAQQQAAREMLPKALQYAKDALSQMADPAESYNQQPSPSTAQAQPLSLGGMAQQPQGAGKEGLLDALKSVESGGKLNAVSPAGAKGPYQFMDATAKQYGVQDPFNEAQSRAGADKMLSHLTDKYGDTTKALQAYNWGEGNMDAYLKTGKGVNGQAMPQETQQYANKVLSRANKLNDPELTGPAATAANNLRTADGKVPDDIRTTAVKQQKSIADTLDKMSEFYMMNGNVDMADQFATKAQKARAIEVQQRQEAYKEKKESITQIGSMVSTVNSQSDWTGTLAAIKSDPVMRANLQGLNITGVYEQDKHAIDSLKQRTLTVKDQEDLKLKVDSSDMKYAQAQMKQQKFDMDKTREDAFMDDQMRKAEGARKAGIPKDPVPDGLLDPKTRTRVAPKIQGDNTKMEAEDNNGARSARNAVQILNQLDGLYKQGLRTGPVIGEYNLRTGEDLTGKFNKLSNQLVQDIQSSIPGTSAKTAAMYKNLVMSKPDPSKPPGVNQEIIEDYRNRMTEELSRVEFYNQYQNYNNVRADAGKWWNQYTAKYPQYTYDRETGKAVLDKNRPTWQEYFKKAE